MMILVTGGSGSGKSAFAEDCVVSCGETERIYIATMYPFDEESRRRVQRHQKMRQGKGFETVECYTGLHKVQVPENSTVLLECMSNLTANEMFRQDPPEGDVADRIIQGVERLRRQARNLVIVSNEIFSDGCEYASETREYQRVLGTVNCLLAKMAEQVTEVVYGIPLEVKR